MSRADDSILARACRLDRLILLLDTGSTPSVRLTAARQLGAIAGTRVAHPSTNSHGHASVGTDVKLEEGMTGASKEGVWHGVEGEWNEVIGLAARVSSSCSSLAVLAD